MKTNNTGTSTDPTLQILLGSVSDPHCFYILQLLDEKGTVRIDNIELRTGEPTGVIEQLEQTHFPRLEDEGYIETNPNSAKVTKGPNFEKLKPYLKNWSFNNQ